MLAARRPQSHSLVELVRWCSAMDATRKMDARRHGDANPGLPAWTLEEAKARFSELVRQARERGPQRVTVRGQDAVVVLSAADYARLAPAASKTTLASLFGDSP